MMKSEFVELIGEEVADSDYAIIEKVYTYHPAIADKKSIASLYKSFGMTAIADMVPRAERVERIESEIQRRKTEISRFEEELEQERRNY